LTDDSLIQRTRSFGRRDQVSFADLAGDWNPIHLDHIAARRSVFGQPIVHGVHTLLWALEEAMIEPATMVELDVSFPKPVFLGQPVKLSIQVESTDENRRRLLLSASVGTGEVLKATVEIDVRGDSTKELPPAILDQAWPRSDPIERGASSLPGLTGSSPLRLDRALAARLFPRLSSYLDSSELALLLGTSRVVGMSCPGLYSLFSSLRLRPTDSANDGIDWAVYRFDERFGRCVIRAVGVAMQAEITAFLRRMPTVQPDLAAVAAHVEPSRFVGTRAVIVGGSRGLGEVAAKVLVAGGAEVALTFHRGSEEAAALAMALQEGGGRAAAVPLDVVESSLPPPLPFGEQPTAVLYFATPAIFVGDRRGFSDELLGRFRSFYVTGLDRLVRFYAEGGTRMFYSPSSVAVDDPPPDMAEYAAAKLEQEQWAQHFMQESPDVSIVTPRLPRLATDQTASNMPVENLDPVPLMVAELEGFITR